MPVSKAHGGDSIAIKALKSINSPFLTCRDGFVLSSQRDSETNREGGESTLKGGMLGIPQGVTGPYWAPRRA